MTEHPLQRTGTRLRRWTHVHVLLASLMLLVGSALLLPVSHSSCAESPDNVLRVGFSRSMFTEVNENDVKAAMKAWAQVLMRDQGLSVDPNVTVLNGIKEIDRALRAKRIDAFALTTDEYWTLDRDMLSSHTVVGVFDGRITEEYVLLVHRESGIERIGDLRGRTINLFTNPRMSLAPVWLDTLLMKDGLGPASSLFSRVTQLNKLSRVILPVFFRQSDACVVLRRAFQTMSELNPQVGQKLKVVASSPQLVPAGFFFRADVSSATREKAFREFERIHTVPAGQQALTVFQSGNLEVHTISALNSAFELLNRHRRLYAATSDSPGEAGLMRQFTATDLVSD